MGATLAFKLALQAMRNTYIHEVYLKRYNTSLNKLPLLFLYGCTSWKQRTQKFFIQFACIRDEIDRYLQ